MKNPNGLNVAKTVKILKGFVRLDHRTQKEQVLKIKKKNGFSWDLVFLVIAAFLWLIVSALCV